MCKQPFTPPFSATDQPGAPLYLGTTYNLLANLVALSEMHTPLQVSMEKTVWGDCQHHPRLQFAQSIYLPVALTLMVARNPSNWGRNFDRNCKCLPAFSLFNFFQRFNGGSWTSYESP